MQGAGGAARVLLGREAAEAFGARVGSFVDAGGPDLADRVKGALVLGLPLFEAHPGFADRLIDRIEAADDQKNIFFRKTKLTSGSSPVAWGKPWIDRIVKHHCALMCEVAMGNDAGARVPAYAEKEARGFKRSSLRVRGFGPYLDTMQLND
jgi:hypothetical protein